MPQIDRISQVSAIAAIIGGVLLLYKAVQILITGDQPPLAFEIAPVFFAIAMFGLLVRVVNPSGIRRSITGLLIVLALVAAVGGLAIDDEGEGSKYEVISSLFDVISGLGPVVVLILLGLPIFRRRLWSPGWRYLPLGLGLGFIPALIVGAILESAFGERYLEIPLVVIGVAWILFAYPLLVRK
jgi:hypothetical protein